MSKGRVQNIGIVSLSSGLAGDSDYKYLTDIGLKRLHEFGVKVKFMPHALMGSEYISAHPDKRAEDLLTAFRDPEIDMILCAFGGDDTYRLIPYLFDNNELKDTISKQEIAASHKIFLGFSDTTMNHFMLHKAGLNTFYGQTFISDICEPGPEMLPYTKKYFEELITTGTISKITPSDVWYRDRDIFDKSQLGVPIDGIPDYGFELLQGPSVFSGKILGGCIDIIYDMFNGERHSDTPMICKKYSIFPEKDDWKGKILLLESCEEQPSPEKYKQALSYLKDMGVFDVVSGVICGKPMDEVYASEYKELLVSTIQRPDLPIVFNINIGHAMPRCIIPFGVEATVDTAQQMIKFK